MISIRQMLSLDVEVVSKLCDQLGYSTSTNETRTRFEKINKSNDHVIFVATDHTGKVIGFIHGRLDESLHKGSTCEIPALVIEESKRGMGIGKQLIGAIESWLSERRIENIWLLSNVVRENAHSFYRSNGYQTKKSAHLFEKKLINLTSSPT